MRELCSFVGCSLPQSLFSPRCVVHAWEEYNARFVKPRAREATASRSLKEESNALEN